MSETGSIKDAHIDSKKSKVHSANAWETADLGDEERNNKFLRLMGAGKKEHHGRIVIGDQKPEHIRNSQETEKIQHELLDQYEQSMQHRLAGGRRGHLGLGYQEPEKESAPPEDAGEANSGDAEGTEAQDSTDSGTDSKDQEEKTETKEANRAIKGESEKVESDGHFAEGNKRRDDGNDDISTGKKLKTVKASS